MTHILVVDDSSSDRRLAGGLLSDAYTVEFASNGVDALEHMEARLPLAVVTDLGMPEMDGMQLVNIVRDRFPQVPIILMTSHGSEDVALDALMCGASDYVPKTRLKSDLAASVSRAVAVRVADRAHQMLSHCLRRQEFEYELDNDVLLVAPLVSQFQSVARDLALFDESDCVRLGKAVVEALRNAIFHGNLELPFDQVNGLRQSPEHATEEVHQRREQKPYCDRRVHVHAVFRPDETRLTIRDEGPGFDTSRVPDFAKDSSHLVGDGGRGLALIHLFMGEIILLPPGNEITMIRRAHHGTRTRPR